MYLQMLVQTDLPTPRWPKATVDTPVTYEPSRGSFMCLLFDTPRVNSCATIGMTQKLMKEEKLQDSMERRYLVTLVRGNKRFFFSLCTVLSTKINHIAKELIHYCQ